MCSERPSTLDFIASCYILRHCQVTSTQSRNCHEDNLNSETRGEFIIAGHSYVTTIIDSNSMSDDDQIHKNRGGC